MACGRQIVNVKNRLLQFGICLLGVYRNGRDRFVPGLWPIKFGHHLILVYLVPVNFEP